MTSRSLEPYREYFRGLTVREQIDRVFKLAGVKEVVMTNDPFDPQERAVWQRGVGEDPRFRSSLRIDPLLLDFPWAAETLQAEGYAVTPDLGGASAAEVRRFLRDWTLKINALYLAASLPCSFDPAQDGLSTRVLKECILPVCGELDVPFALMIGVKRQVNPRLGLAGDSVGKAQIGAVERLCAEYPDNKFLVTMLSRENQHELAITARKYRNLMVFGCWWFLNNPSLVQEITAMRLETLGLSFIPQHSDARGFGAPDLQVGPLPGGDQRGALGQVQGPAGHRLVRNGRGSGEGSAAALPGQFPRIRRALANTSAFERGELHGKLLLYPGTNGSIHSGEGAQDLAGWLG